MSSPPAGSVPAAPFSDADYQRETAALLARIEAAADRWLQDDVIDIDTHRTGGLLELSFPNGSKIIINTQPPLQRGVAGGTRRRLSLPLERWPLVRHARRQRVHRRAVGACQPAGRQGAELRLRAA